MTIDFQLSDEQKALQTNARAFAQNVLSKVAPTITPIIQPVERFYATRPFYDAMAEAGFVKSLLPTTVGGTAMSILDFAIASEELTVFDVNVPSTLLATGLGLQPIINYGSEAQQQKFLVDFAENGSLLASLAFTEITGGANYDNENPEVGCQTFARLEGDEWVINGEKHHITNGTGWEGKGPHLFSVVCRTDPKKTPQESLAVIVVPGDTPGIEITGYLNMMGHRATSSPRIRFNNVRVPAENIIGKPGDGMAIVENAFSWTAALIGAGCVGVMRGAFDTAYKFARSDKRSGPVPVIEYQNVGFMLADIKMRIEAARYLTWKSCHQLALSKRKSSELAIMTKVYCSEVCVQAVYDSMRVVGVDSYTDMYPLAGLMQDALCFPLYDGGNMGVRRRQLHDMLRSDDYDPMASAEAR